MEWQNKCFITRLYLGLTMTLSGKNMELLELVVSDFWSFKQLEKELVHRKNM